MGYSKYRNLKVVTKKFGLSATQEDLFLTTIPDILPSSWLVETLQMAKIVPLINEKAKSERIISPILIDIANFFKDKITLFSGEKLEVNALENLSGECDFFFTLIPRSPYLEAPIISLVEAKNDDMDYGIAQCAAQLYGTKLYNELDGQDIPILYGCTTNGTEWKFMRFENNIFYVDTKIYTDLKEILGVWHHIIKSYLK